MSLRVVRELNNEPPVNQQQLAPPLPPEEIQKYQDAQLYKTDVIEKDITAIWKLTEMSTNWDLHFGSASGPRSNYLTVVVGKDTEVKFLFDLRITHMPGSGECLIFYFQPGEIPPSITSIFGKLLLEMLDKDGNPFYTLPNGPFNWLNSDPDFDVQNQYGYDLPFNVQYLLRDEVLGEDDSLTIRVTFTHICGRTLDYPNAAELQAQALTAVAPIMPTDMEALLNDTSNADIQLKMKDGTLLQAHKLILAARSPIFKTMLFECDFIEKGASVVEISDLSSETMKILLYYIYTGKLHETWRNDVGELLIGANKYLLQGLILYADHLMITLCTDFNAEDLLAIAKLHSLERATKEIEKYIKGITI